MSNDNLMLQTAKLIPLGIRQAIIQERFIDRAVNVDIKNTPMEYLFDVYVEFLDPNGDSGNWYCPKCRAKVLSHFKMLQPYLIEANEINASQR